VNSSDSNGGILAASTFIDLFAGIGGMRLGFERAGGRCVFTSEWDRFAQRTYSANFPGEIRGDITKVRLDEIPDHDLLVAGFPCQPFSLAGVSKNNALGREHGFRHETQGTLFFHVARILEAKRPRAFLLENVKNLASHDRGRTMQVIRQTLEDELGYQLYVEVIDAAPLVPQHRERVYLVGFREPAQFAFPQMPVVRQSLGEILESDVDARYTLTPALWLYLQNYAAKHRAAGHGFGYGLIDPEDPDAVARTLSARYHKDGSEILVRQGDGVPRRLTPRECARLMGFPDSFQVPVSDSRAYRQFGNSVVVPVVEEIACAMNHAIRGALPEISLEGYQSRLALTVPGTAGNGG
jgi:DNA (cytosine-5)-methyltransferase 1